MARSKNPYSGGQRDYLNQSLATLLHSPIRPMPLLLPLPNPTPIQVLPYAGDRRRFNPSDSTQAPAAVRSGASRVVADPWRPSGTRFADPKYVGICARRKVRKEVLFAKRLTRSGAGSKKHFNFWSKVKC